MAGKRVGSPLGVTLVAMLLAGLITALVLSFVLEDDETAGPPVLTLAPGAGDGTIPPGELEGEPAPDFTFEPLTGGADIDFETFRAGRPALINFFYNGCVPCVVEMPDLEDAFETYGDQVAFLGLSSAESVRAGRELVERTGVTYDIGRDPDGDIITAFAGGGYPTTVFIAADGTITTSHLSQIHPDELRDELNGLLA